MSRLNVYWPDDCKSVARATVPSILPFPRPIKFEEQRGEPLDIVTRARVMFQNRRCQHCGYPVVEPLELDDALMNTSGREIPGTATLVGFRCHSCDAAWSI